MMIGNRAIRPSGKTVHLLCNRQSDRMMVLFGSVLLTTLICIGAVRAAADIIGVRHLVGEPDYRKVTLRWEAYTRTGRSHEALPHFQVRYCELQSWGTQRCRIHETETNDVWSEDETKTYETSINGLRMATTYSFEVQPGVQTREDRADDQDENNIIIVPTKGFSARATLCLPRASEIEVSTGPNFAGRITVEATDGERCTVDGEPDNPRDTYILHIDHAACGSFVNETTVATYVIVQENLPILTHSTRRFLVLCTYQPETLTVRAGLSLPSGRGYGQSSPVQDSDSGSVRRSRHLRPLKLEGEELHSTLDTNRDHVTPVIVTSVLIILGVFVIVLTTIRWRRKLQSTTINNDNESLHVSNESIFEPNNLCNEKVDVQIDS